MVATETLVSPQKLQALRLLAGLSQRKLARKAGVSLDTIQSWEGGRFLDARASKLARVARALGVALEQLLD